MFYRGGNPAATEVQYKLKSVLLAGAPSLLVSFALFLPFSSRAADLNTLETGQFAQNRPFPAAFTVLDWNIDQGRHLEEIERQISELVPALCLFQEVDRGTRRTNGRNVTRDLAVALHLNYVFAPEFHELSQGSADAPAYQGQALLTTLPVRASRLIRFAHQSGFWKPNPLMSSHIPLMQRREGGRIALVAELDAGGKTLVVYNLHLESKGTEGLRSSQLAEVLADAAHYPADTPIILAGDLNTFVFHSRLIPQLTAAGFRSVLGSERPRTHVLLGELDWLVVRGALRFDHAQVLHVHGSDHYPIRVDLGL